MLAAVVHNVFETDQMESALPANGHKVHLTMSCGEQFGSIRLAYGDSPYYKFAPPPPTSSPSLRWTYHIKWGETSRFCLFRRNDYLSLGLQCFAIEYESYSLFFFSCFPARLYQKVHAQLGKRLQKDQSPDKLLLVNAIWEYKKLHYDNCGHIVSLLVTMNGFEDYILSLSFQDRIVRACLRFLRVVCISCVALHLPVDFRVRLLASTLYFLRKLEQNKKNFTEDRKKDDRLRDIKSGLHQSEKIEQSIREQGRFSDNESITEEGYLLAVSLLEGCDPCLLPELLEGLGDEIVSKLPSSMSHGSE